MKSQNKNIKDTKNIKSTKKRKEDDSEDGSCLKDEHEIEEMLEEEMHGELDAEDDEEFIHNVEEFKKEHSKTKMVTIFNMIKKPEFPDVKKIDPKSVKDELQKLILHLDKFNIIVHFHNECPDTEKYRFITEEVFKEAVEEDKNHHHVTFLYEDYHPEMDDEDEDEEFL
ncbi:MAG: hypothetical protein ABIY50_01555 [Ignavibacteria bacterium]